MLNQPGAAAHKTMFFYCFDGFVLTPLVVSGGTTSQTLISTVVF